MAKKNRNTLKSYFELGDRPTEGQYANLIDSFIAFSGENTGSLNLKGDTNLNGDLTASGDVRVLGQITVVGNGTFAKVNTGQGDTEVHLMNQNIRTSDNVEFVNITATGNTILGNAFSDTHTFTGHITSSHHISSSGNIIADRFFGDGTKISNITSSKVIISGVTASFTS